jgi:ATP adenylyltransferase
MERLWSPWRSAYMETFKKPKKTPRGRSVFTQALLAKDDDARFIVLRRGLCFVIMNLYPYNSGHLMVVPYRQVGDLRDLTGEELSEMMDAVRLSMRALDEVMSPQGYNVGVNIGRAAGAGVDGHVHIHVVPRWNGDTNFMPVLGDTKVISEDMRKTLLKLRKAMKKGLSGARNR